VVGELLDALLLRAQLALEHAHPCEQQTGDAAGSTEQPRDADRKYVRIVARGRTADPREKAERGGE